MPLLTLCMESGNDLLLPTVSGCIAYQSTGCAYHAVLQPSTPQFAAVAGAGGDPQGMLKITPLPMYSLPTDGVLMTCVGTTRSGRIFMGGDDGHVYEVTYSAGESGGVLRKVMDKLTSAERKRCALVCTGPTAAAAAAAATTSGRTAPLLPPQPLAEMAMICPLQTRAATWDVIFLRVLDA